MLDINILLNPNPLVGKSVFASVSFISSGITMLLILLVAIRGKRTLDEFLYCALLTAITLWSFSLAMAIHDGSSYSSHTYNYLLHVFSIPIPFLDFLFVIHFFDKFKNYRTSIMVLASATLINEILLLTTPYFINPIYQEELGYYAAMPGPAYLFWLIPFYTYMIYVAILLNKWRVSHPDIKKRSQAGYFLVAVVIGYSAGITDHSLNYGYYWKYLYPWGNITVPMYALIVLFGIVKGQIFDIHIVIKKTLVYTCVASLISVVYVLGVFFFHSIFQSQAPQDMLSTKTIFLIIIITIVVKPLESFVRRFLDRKIYKGTIDQISSQKEHLESELERSERLKSVGILAAGMAHEIRNPIQSLMTFGEHLEQKHNDPEFRAKFEVMLKRETGRIKDLTSDLLEFSKPKDPNRQMTDLSQLIDEVMELVSTELTKQGITHKINSPKEAVYANVDSDQIKQALLNLILNAKDAMQDSITKELTITLEDKTISIQDTGCGIAPDKIPHLFDPFYTSKEKGTGLGLAITHSLIEKNDGGVFVASQINKGSEFRIEFD